MINLESDDYSYSNVLIMRIKEMIDKSDYSHNDCTESGIINIALNIMRIMCEIPLGNGEEDEREWELFFKAQKTERDLIFLFYHLDRMSLVKNELLNEVIKTTNKEDLERLINKIKGDD